MHFIYIVLGLAQMSQLKLVVPARRMATREVVDVLIDLFTAVTQVGSVYVIM